MDILSANSYLGNSDELLLHQLFEQQVEQTPNTIAVQFDDEKLTYAQLNAKADHLASEISQIAPESLIIGVSTSRGIATIISVLAILKCGKAYLPLDPTYPKDRLEQIINDSGVSLCLAPSNEDILFKHLSINILPSDKYYDTVEFTANNKKTTVAYVIYTSGSTGKPKGVCVGHSGVINLILWHKKHSKLRDGDRTLQFAPLSFDESVKEIFCTITIGGTLVLVDNERRLDPYRLLRYVDEQQVNRMILPFVALQYFTEAADVEKFYPESLQEFITAGEQLKITPQIVRFFVALPQCDFYNMYGPTEASVTSTSLHLEGSPYYWSLLPAIGKAIDNTEMFVLDEQLKLLPDGEVGELCISGANLALGYLNRKDLTGEKFIDWEYAGKIIRIYRSGDLCRVLTDGNIEYLGRKDTQVKIRGNRVEIGEIEVLLNHLPGIQQAVVIAREDNPGDKRLVAYLVSMLGKGNTAQIRDIIEQKLPDYMMPSAFVWLDELPKTTSGKVDRNALPKPNLKRPELNNVFHPPSTYTQKRLTELWNDLLQLENIGINDNFFELGGNSLIALKTITALKKQFGYQLPVTKLYQLPTISGIAAHLDGKSNTATEVVLPKSPAKNNTDVAVIGMAGRFPGADTIEELWNILIEGRETIKFFTDAELDPYIPSSIKNASNYVKARGIINKADEFDAAFFGLNPKVAELMDPQQRIFLEIAWEVLEQTGYLPSKYKGSVGVFAGCGNNTYYINNVISNKELINNVGEFLVTTLNEKDYIASRTAYELNLKGPAISVHSACSTSLLAIAEAVGSIRSGQCDVALAGGASITSPINSGHLYQAGTMLSADGHCRSFDARGDGTVFSDGAGVVLLKSLAEAEKDGDTIYAVIKGVGLNNDGAGKGSFTAPNATGQAGAIKMAINNSGISAGDISYVEAHGTATILGDPIEIEGLKLAFGQQEKKQYCAIGSVKSNLGHLTAASGVAGFIKTTLSLHHRQIPASINYDTPNPNIDFENSPFYVNTQLTDWGNGEKLIAGISSFGVGGTNVHVILADYLQAPKVSSAGRDVQLISWSAKTENSAENYREKLAEYIKCNPEVSIADIAYTLQNTKESFNQRSFVLADSRDDLINKLSATDGVNSNKLTIKGNEVVFLFPGQGSQFVNMGKDLYEKEIVFKEAVDECVSYLKHTIQENILEVIFNNSTKDEAETALKNTLYTQPALFIISYATAKLWMSWGIMPTVLTGHSIGEFVAAHFAGVFSLADAVKLIGARAEIVSKAEAGNMLSVRLPEEQLKAILPDTLSIAVINTSKTCVVAGATEEINKFSELLDKQNIASRLLQTSHAFHSAMMDDIVEPFEAIVKQIKLNPPVKPIVSAVTGKWLSEKEATSATYWAQHLRNTVRFADAVSFVTEDESRILLEVGPGNVLATLVRQQTAGKEVKVIAGFTKEEPFGYNSVLKALGLLWLNGIEPDWKAFYGEQNRLRVDLPTYAFDRKRTWVNPATLVNTVMPTFEVKSETLIENSTEIPVIMADRKNTLIPKLKAIFENASGIDIDSTDVSFVEAGFDSLLLTQIATNLKKEFNVPVTFRKLFEDYSSLESLALYLDEVLPADSYQQEVTSQFLQSHNQIITPAGINGANPALDMIAQQLQALANQVVNLQNGNHQAIRPSTTTKPSANGHALSAVSQFDLTPEEHIEAKKPFGATARIEKHVQGLNDKQQAFLEKLVIDYNKKTRGSKDHTQKHRSYMADPRVVSGFRPLTKEIVYPIVVNKSKGSRLWDIDGNEYIDALNGFGSNMLGYQPEPVKKAIQEQLEKGYEIGPQHELAGEVCDLLCEFTGFDRAALCSTGSEGVLGAMRIARTVTGRSIIVAFSGSYHGIMDEVIVRGTKKLRTIPAAPGIMPEAVQNMLILDYGTEQSLRIIEERGHEIAAVLVEVVQSRRPEFVPVDFLKKLRKITAAAKTALVFDEVITGFRMHPGGMQAILGIKADIGTYGKVIGGGLPVGVIAGIKEYMDALDGGYWQYGDSSTPEAGVTYFAGTFVRHPLALAATKASLLYMKEKGPNLQQGLTDKTTYLVKALNEICQKYNTPCFVAQYGSLWKLKYREEYPYSELFFTQMRLKGIHIWDGFPCFMTDAHTQADIDTIIKCFEESVSELVAAEFIPSSDSFADVAAPFVEKRYDDRNVPPLPGAKLGRDKNGNPAWFISDDKMPGKYIQIK
ncbi:polyketide synthase [Mucilaginibacter segetis]|uniref:Amino acid adenylation domain-containing protein n=1 Tax=Mucilaginibacter segetis TaxID=2793071 RepID=A0A934PT47_9SPHI|nr:polyketide synthase [Mucilaginibacter segetis]MBK0379126.1 amino acid adenylation domain-containing protein [Mucilaginibacter segetis]